MKAVKAGGFSYRDVHRNRLFCITIPLDRVLLRYMCVAAEDNAPDGGEQTLYATSYYNTTTVSEFWYCTPARGSSYWRREFGLLLGVCGLIKRQPTTVGVLYVISLTAKSSFSHTTNSLLLRFDTGTKTYFGGRVPFST